MLSAFLTVVLLAASPAVDASIASAKLRHPETFARVSSVLARAPALDREKRGPLAPLTPLFRAAGPDALPALLEPLVHPERFTMPAEESARVAVRTGLIEAAGALADPSAAPVWRSILASSSEPHELRAAAEALGRVATAADVTSLEGLVRTKGPKQRAAVLGVFTCRAVEIARALGDAAIASPDLGVAAARSLGKLGSSWAPGVPAPLREEAARQALRLYLAASASDARDAASDAVMTIDAPGTPAAIAAARSPKAGAALDALAARFAKNPVRR